MRSILSLVAAIALASCVTKPIVEPYNTPDGANAFVVHCGGTQLSIADCYSAARTQCGGDYTILQRLEEQRGMGMGESRRIEFVCKST